MSMLQFTEFKVNRGVRPEKQGACEVVVSKGTRSHLRAFCFVTDTRKNAYDSTYDHFELTVAASARTVK